MDAIRAVCHQGGQGTTEVKEGDIDYQATIASLRNDVKTEQAAKMAVVHEAWKEAEAYEAEIAKLKAENEKRAQDITNKDGIIRGMRAKIDRDVIEAEILKGELEKAHQQRAEDLDEVARQYEKLLIAANHDKQMAKEVVEELSGEVEDLERAIVRMARKL